MVAALKELGRECAGANCETRVLLRYALYCDPCRAQARRRRKVYISNDFIDRQIKRAYHERLDKRLSPIPHLKTIARKIGWPPDAVKRRARELGLSRTKESPWTEEELHILERFAWMSDQRIVLKLKAAGFHRTATAVHVKSKRIAAKQNTPYFTARALGDLFGVDSHQIGRWIGLGLLYGRKQEQPNILGRDRWLIHENDVRRFILSHPMEFDIRKVDQLWFLDLITEGKICDRAIDRPSTELSFEATDRRAAQAAYQP